MRAFAAGILALLASPAVAGVHPPEVEKQLAFVAGDWTIKGLEANYRDNCTWFDSNSFVVCDTTKKTISIYRESKLYELPDDLRGRLHSAIVTKCKAKKPDAPASDEKTKR